MSPSGIKLLGLGNPLLDISAEVPLSFLEEYELKLNNGILAEEKHLTLYDRLVKEFPVTYIGGGSAQGSVRVAQWMSEPNCTGYMGCIGKDSNGEKLRSCLTEDGVNVHYMVDDITPTGTCASLVNGGERSLVANLAAANNFKFSHLNTPEAKNMIESAEIIYAPGFFLTVSLESILHVAKHAASNGKIFATNLSALFIVDFFGDQLSQAIHYADYVFGNESEAAAFGKKHKIGSNLNEIALSIASFPKASGTHQRTVVITQGADCTIVASNGKVQMFEVPKLDPALLVDTNGAGDAFVGGFMSQLMKSKPLDKCIDAGHWAAGQIIQSSGCSFKKECNYYKK